jgi:rhamnulokinase
VNNRLLCQLTADATGRQVQAGPVEATAAGNVLTQAIGVGAVGSLPEARVLLRNSIELARFDPRPSLAWDAALDRMNALAQ